MNTVYFDVMCGASGDMILASLVDLGVPLSWLRRELARMPVPGLAIDVERAVRGGFACSHLRMSWDEAREYRHLPDILQVIKQGNYSETVYRRCESVLTRLGEAEARVHGVSIDKIHFHEVGAADTIVDIAGACLCLEYLKADAVSFSSLTVGHGTVAIAHGNMPVPVPAVSKMIEGFAVRPLDIPTEILTPTGCALLTALGTQHEGLPAGIVRASGYGCGDREFAGHANSIRAFLVSSEEHAGETGGGDTVCVLESDMDHVSGEVMAYAAERLVAQGALDVSWSPVYMKKGRPGYRLTVVAAETGCRELADTIIRETRTLGVRVRATSRITAAREPEEIAFMDSTVSGKRCSHGNCAFTKIEYESAAHLARKAGRPLLEIMEEYIRDRGKK